MQVFQKLKYIYLLTISYHVMISSIESYTDCILVVDDLK